MPVTSQVGRLKFTEARDDLIAYHVANGRDTKKLERRIAKHLTPYFWCLKMTAISTANVNDYIAKRRKEAPRTRQSTASWRG